MCQYAGSDEARAYGAKRGGGGRARENLEKKGVREREARRTKMQLHMLTRMACSGKRTIAHSTRKPFLAIHHKRWWTRWPTRWSNSTALLPRWTVRMIIPLAHSIFCCLRFPTRLRLDVPSIRRNCHWVRVGLCGEEWPGSHTFPWFALGWGWSTYIHLWLEVRRWFEVRK